MHLLNRLNLNLSLFANTFKFSSRYSHLKGSRFYLSPAYNSDQKWNERFQSKYIKETNPVQFYISIIKKYQTDGKLSAIDTDILFGSLTEEHASEMVDEIEEVLRLLRRSPENIYTLPSTMHSVLRLLINLEKYDLILRILSDPMNYGLFLDFYDSNLLMNIFLLKRNYMAAARVASLLMLQEDFGPPLTRAFVLLSCCEYILNPEEKEPWVDYNPVVEPEEEVKVVVPYIRNPFFDDHFDLKNPKHIVGKTLAWLSYYLDLPPLEHDLELLGWCFYEKWEKFSDCLQKVLKEKRSISSDVFSKLVEQVETCEDEGWKPKLSLKLTHLQEKNLVSEELLLAKAKQNLEQCVEQFESQTIMDQNKTYDEWIERRKTAVQKQIDEVKKIQLVQEIEKKKQDLQRREDIIFFFDNQDKLEMLFAKKEEEEQERQKLKEKLKSKAAKKGVDLNYIPPTV